ncbi:MAG: D-tyrosyl-tRNA(Tyr) deacylase [Deltaproteobacteria bacterium]|nr:D-tyrosyl-tRNA(Tyr) deacylase [Deltaproteobacteria bacterium]NIS77501.1 D-tyrosyl-tRNA(Tyr) deacylase [Deltaproteobacteria bacterium]
MRAVIQRVLRAKITAGGREVAAISRGILVFLAVQRGDGEADVEYISRKIFSLRIFPSEDGKKESELSVFDVGGEICLVPQFTLAGDARKGNRPSYSDAEEPEIARKLFSMVLAALERKGHSVVSGAFREHMQVEIINDGPYTVMLDSKKKF